jgi:hypothetical protein
MKPRQRIEDEKPQASNDVEIGVFESQLEINKYDLDTEVSKQPRIAEQVGERYAMAKSLRDQAKDDLKTVAAERAIEIRAQRDRDGEKITDKIIEDLVQIDQFRKKAFKRYVEAERYMTHLEELRDSFRERGFMLKEMCNLWHSSYFDDPSHRKPDSAAARNDEYEANKARLNEQRRERNMK